MGAQPRITKYVWCISIVSSHLFFFLLQMVINVTYLRSIEDPSPQYLHISTMLHGAKQWMKKNNQTTEWVSYPFMRSTKREPVKGDKNKKENKNNNKKHGYGAETFMDKRKYTTAELDPHLGWSTIIKNDNGALSQQHIRTSIRRKLTSWSRVVSLNRFWTTCWVALAPTRPPFPGPVTGKSGRLLFRGSILSFSLFRFVDRPSSPSRNMGNAWGVIICGCNSAFDIDSIVGFLMCDLFASSFAPLSECSGEYRQDTWPFASPTKIYMEFSISKFIKRIDYMY